MNWREQHPIGRRQVLTLAIASTIGLISCATQQARAEPIAVDTTGVKDLRDLIRAIRATGGKLLPPSDNDDFILVALAKSFVENAREAVDRHGIKVPSWIIERLPGRKASLDSPDKTDAIVLITILGVIFVLPRLIFFTLVLGSILFMTNFIADELRRLTAKNI